ncbi:MAG TPA: hypothetical protein VNH11_05640 [Pirellulales bacterium]|nr:hypothetical protein [Pirellulales bacterium]
MARMARQRWTLVLLAAALVWPAAPALAQAPLPGRARMRPIARSSQARRFIAEPMSEEIAPPSPNFEQPRILQSLPELPDQPASLFQPAPPPGPPAPDWEHPYFERDPLLDPVDWPRSGWFADAEVSVIKTHVNFSVPITTGLGTTGVVQLSPARLNWTAAPRLEVGYRLPSGFGEISISDRYFNAMGSDTFLGPDGPAARHTEFMVNYTDIDYASRELTPNPGWGLKFRGGLRAAQTFLGTRVDESLAQAAAGSRVFAQRETNRTTAFGPHFGVEVDRRFARQGLTWVNQVDVAEMFTRVRQEAFAATTTVTPTGFDSGDTVTHFLQYVPVLTAQIGVSWQPPRWANSRLYVGYIGQFWYQFGTNSNVSFGPFLQPKYTQFDNQGITLQWSWNH